MAEEKKIKGNANERKSIYYENQIRQKEGEPTMRQTIFKREVLREWGNHYML